MNQNLPLEFTSIEFPDEPPIGWPFEDFVAPSDWEKTASPAAWISFFYVDIGLSVQLKRKKLNATRFIFGHSSSLKSPARVSLKNETLFVCLSTTLFVECMISTSAIEEDIEEYIYISDNNELYKKFFRSINTADSQQLIDRVRVSGLLIHFIVEHEIAHTLSGHFDLIKNHIINKQLIRAIELAADRIAFFNCLPVMIISIIVESEPIDDIEKINYMFGYGLAVLFFRKSINHQNVRDRKYPTFFERIFLLCGSCLIPCVKSKNIAEAAIHLAYLNFTGGVKNAIRDFNAHKILELPDAYKFIVLNTEPQHACCVTCSDFARNIASIAQPLFEEVLQMSEEFEKYTYSKRAFTKDLFSTSRFNGLNSSYCPAANPFRYKIESIRRQIIDWFMRINRI